METKQKKVPEMPHSRRTCGDFSREHSAPQWSGPAVSEADPAPCPSFPARSVACGFRRTGRQRSPEENARALPSALRQAIG